MSFSLLDSLIKKKDLKELSDQYIYVKYTKFSFHVVGDRKTILKFIQIFLVQCYGLDCVPQKSHIEVLTLLLKKVTVFEDKIFKDELS